MNKLETILNGVNLKNPVIAASGTFAFGEEFSEYFDLSKLGALCTTGITYNPRKGNDGRRIHEITGGVMNSIGLQNDGIDDFLDNELEKILTYNTAIIANLGGGSMDEYLKGANKLDGCKGIDIIELNISCPNVQSGGSAFGIKSRIAKEVVSEVRKITDKPLMVKLSPSSENIVEMALSCQEAGADSLSLVNTFRGVAIDIDTRKMIFNNIFAGVSGPCIKPMALGMTYEVCKAVDIPVVGIGGIVKARDAIEYIMAGSTAIQVGCANFIKPDVSLDIIKGIENFMEKEGIKSLEEIRGIL